MNKEQMQANATYSRAINGQSMANDLKVINEFRTRGISATPRVGTFTRKVWKNVKSRQVQQGEKGVKVFSFREDKKGNKRPVVATVFHISQTLPIQ